MKEQICRKIAVKNGLAKNSNLNVEEIGRLLAAILSLTSGSHLDFRIEITGFTHSSKDAENIKISSVKNDIGHRKIVIKMQLAGRGEIWSIDLYLKKEMWNTSDAFCQEIKSAAEIVCNEEAEMLKAEKSDSDFPNDTEGTENADASPRTRKPKVMTAEIVTDEMIGKIFELWIREFPEAKRISQRQFIGLLPSVLPDNVNKQMAVSFLKKKGLITVIPQERKPEVEITDAGFAFMKKREEKKKIEERAIGISSLLEEALKFPEKALPLLRYLEKWQAAHLRLEEVRREKANTEKEIRELKDKLASQEKEFSRLEGVEKRAVSELEKLASFLKERNLSELIELAESSTMKN